MPDKIDMCVCEVCNETKDLILCEVCRRPICKKCSQKNNIKKNPMYETKHKDICDYCADIYWLGF